MLVAWSRKSYLEPAKISSLCTCELVDWRWRVSLLFHLVVSAVDLVDPWKWCVCVCVCVYGARICGLR